MMESMKTATSEIQLLRTDNVFSELFAEAIKSVKDYNLEMISLPRQHKPPKRLDSGSDAHVFDNAAAFTSNIS